MPQPPLSPLIPIPNFLTGFTTCTSLNDKRIQILTLDDQSLGVHRISHSTTHNTTIPPPPQSLSPSSSNIPPPNVAWEAYYPKGSINPTAPIPGGFSFYLSGPPFFSEALEGAKEVVMSYRMMLAEEWDWVKGGKLPGVFGGVGGSAYGCTGGRKEQRCQCFDLRLMWRPKSVGELYTYLPPTPRNAHQLSRVPPLSKENSDYGYSVGRGSFHLDRAVGRWMSVAFRVKLNDVGEENGEITLYIDGSPVISIDRLSLRTSDEGKIMGMHFQTFFGGHAGDWASSKDQRAWFADVTGVIVE
ncbi:polysaccharide lyase family 14 protein [Laccaria amethystina LaAM-08-1]|uniref:Polysaccharide lyase family 14 protein n=1 Tax=Laccaria amethystina LaAM-08-1 TaxID=1095629 RepID=A0A0C9XAS2_9AGAR|nr:polysaccharide lyase family 14 protein [Laccaria amethystina LaAM-08-1]